MDDRTFGLELDRLRRQFAEGLRGRLARLDGAWGELEEGDGAGYEAFYREIHNLAGASESYGLHQLGAEARRLEQLARPLRRRPHQPQLCAELAEGLARVRALAEQALAAAAKPVSES